MTESVFPLELLIFFFFLLSSTCLKVHPVVIYNILNRSWFTRVGINLHDTVQDQAEMAVERDSHRRPCQCRRLPHEGFGCFLLCVIFGHPVVEPNYLSLNI